MPTFLWCGSVVKRLALLAPEGFSVKSVEDRSRSGLRAAHVVGERGPRPQARTCAALRVVLMGR